MPELHQSQHMSSAIRPRSSSGISRCIFCTHDSTHSTRNFTSSGMAAASGVSGFSFAFLLRLFKCICTSEWNVKRKRNRYIELKIWGYILQGRGRPPLEKQREALRALGVILDTQYPPVWIDKIERSASGKKPGERQLDERNGLLLAVQAGDRVAVATPLCLGLSKKDAALFVGGLAARDVALAVSNDTWLIMPGDDTEALLAAVERQRNTANVAAYRKRKS